VDDRLNWTPPFIFIQPFQLVIYSEQVEPYCDVLTSLARLRDCGAPERHLPMPAFPLQDSASLSHQAPRQSEKRPQDAGKLGRTE